MRGQTAVALPVVGIDALDDIVLHHPFMLEIDRGGLDRLRQEQVRQIVELIVIER